MTSNTFILSFILYSLIVYLIKRKIYPFDEEVHSCPIVKWQVGYVHTLFFSPDYWWAFRFKSRIKARIGNKEREALKLYVEQNNKINLYVSSALTAACFIFYKINPDSSLSHTLSAISVIRLFSRGYEISIAFGLDIIQKRKSDTGLTKYERISLALISYLEVFIFSSAAYTALPSITSVLQAIMLALNVGTLTNVGYAFTGLDKPLETHIIFVQVIASQSLVILTLAGYLSRDNKT